MTGALSALKRAFQSCLIGFLLLLTLLCYPTIVILLALFLRPFSKYYFRLANQMFLEQPVFYGFIYPMQAFGHRVVYYGDYRITDESSLVVTNHSYWLDWMMGFYWARGQPHKNLMPRIKMLVKDSLRFVPSVGIALWGAGFLFVSRKWQTDKPYIKAKLSTLLNENLPFIMMLHPEGSRVTPGKLLASQTFAKEHNLPVLQHILTPRVRGFVNTCLGLRPKISAVYDLTIAYASPPSDILRYFIGLSKPFEAHILVKRYDINELPTTEEELSTWLHKLYERKDKAIATFKQTGSFDAVRHPYVDQSNAILLGFVWWASVCFAWLLAVVLLWKCL